MKIDELGEVRLIEHLAAFLGKASWGAGQGVIRGIGDDAAVLQPTAGNRLLVSSDMLLEGQHFDLDYIEPERLGWKALAVSLSDIAAMGGKPRWALISLGLPSSTELQEVEGIYRGLGDLAQKHNVAIVGGDICNSPRGLVIDSIVLGEAPRGNISLRSGASPGDLLAVTGTLGSSAAGLAWLQGKKGVEKHNREEVAETVEAHLRPSPRVREAEQVVGSGKVKAMIDLSDGLAAGLREFAVTGDTGFWIWEKYLPVTAQVKEMAASCNKEYLDWVFYGGEDYELLVALQGGRGAALQLRRLDMILRKSNQAPLTFIGKAVPHQKGNLLIRTDGTRQELDLRGYDHFTV